MHVLVVTNMYPSQARPDRGTFVAEQVESLRQAGVEVDVFSFEADGRLSLYLKAARELRQTLRRQSQPYDLLHAHYGLSGFVACLQPGRPLVVTFHGNDLVPQVGKSGLPTFHGLVETTIGWLAALAANRSIVVADLLKRRVWPRRAITIPMGVDLELFHPIPKNEARLHLELPREGRWVAFVGHPDNLVKRYDLAQAGIQLLKENGWQVELLPVYGVPHSEVPYYMNACDALLLTSLQEASPCVLKEALACNLPVVSTPVGDVPKRISGVRNCALCAPRPQDVAAKLAQVLATGERSNGREAIQSLSLPEVARQVLGVYQEVLTRRAPVHSNNEIGR